jgi:RimJ/RimL family protein N-acetyltransferase
MRIETNRLLLRNYKMKDLKDYIHLMSQEKVINRAGFRFKNNEELLKDLKYECENELKFAIVSKETEKVIGEVGLVGISRQDREMFGVKPGELVREVQFCLSEEYWGKGYMSEAVMAIVKMAFEELDLDTILGACFSKNVASKKVQIKCGLIPYKTNALYVWKETGETCKVILSKITKEQYKHIDSYKKLDIKVIEETPYYESVDYIRNIIESCTSFREL